jgi:hypothetical protein
MTVEATLVGMGQDANASEAFRDLGSAPDDGASTDRQTCPLLQVISGCGKGSWDDPDPRFDEP